MKRIALITARKGSKGLPNKSFKPFYENQSLLDVTVDFVCSASVFHTIYVSTDAENVIYDGVKVIQRSSKLSNDNATQEEVILDFLSKHQINDGELWLFQPTSPIRSMQDLSDMLNQSFVTGIYSASRPFQNPEDLIDEITNQRLFSNVPDYSGRSETDILFENGAFYAFKISTIHKNQKLPQKNMMKLVRTSQESGFDIDDEFQFNLAQLYYERIQNK